MRRTSPFGRSLSFGLALAGAALPARAQVGHLPQNSPYRDIEFKQELTALTGYYRASRDPAGVAPRGGPMAGLFYQIHLGGPAHFYARGARVFSTRTALDPTGTTLSADDRNVSLYLLDVGVALSLTGQKSFHHLVPVVALGAGVASDFSGKADAGRYKFGTPFALSFGGGVRWVPGKNNFQLRFDVTDHLYQIAYPSTYFTAPAAGGEPILGAGVGKRAWQHNGAFTLGFSYLFFR